MRNILNRLRGKAKKPRTGRRFSRRRKKKAVLARAKPGRKKSPLKKRTVSKPAKKLKKKKAKSAGKRKPLKSKTAKLKKSRAKNKPAAKPPEKELGVVTHYFDRIFVAVIKLKGRLKIGDTIRFSGNHGEFAQMVVSMQINRKDILKASSGREIGLRVGKPVHVNDKVYMAMES